MSVSIFYPSSASLYTRVVGTTGLTELHIDVNTANNYVFVLTGSYPITSSIVFIQGMDTGSLYPISASYVLTASYVISAIGVDVLNTQVFL
jgi:hypothetical protein